MNIGQVQNAMIGFTLFDAWAAGMDKINKARNHPASPLVDAAFQAFEGYLATAQAQHAAQIIGAAYALNAQGTGAQLLSRSQMAPLLALNILAY